MHIDELIKQLEQAQGPARFLDRQIAQMLGWKRISGAVGSDGAATILWIPPKGKRAKRVPSYTSSLQDAYALALSIDENHVGAIVRTGGKFTAQIEGGEPGIGNSPAIALTLASLKYKYGR